ncbi:hypothetical protein SLS62_009689 [Diatrype stigma]|uniref:Heterokaryon incompatibility domain-containing protein n=1 Tax=Diatrype stigma TaxID=117547 RepID=A0AAN9UDI3_9PEZI
MATKQTIRYKRLNASKQEFRLLELAPAQTLDDPVVCRLVTVPLTDDLEYLALSSLYGEQTDTERIIVDGTPINITAHLGQALRHVRAVFFPTIQNIPKPQGSSRRSGSDKRGPRWLLHLLRHVSSILPSPDAEAETPLRLWIDMLCINQQDDRENSRQALGRIYKSAKMVIGWLGLKVECTDAGLAVLKEIDDAMPTHWGDPGDKEMYPENYSPRHEWARKIQHIWEAAEGVEAFTQPHWVGANDFMNRPYFQRRWILEEIALGRFPAFLVGDSIVSWKQVLRLNRFMEEFREYPSDLFPPRLRAMIADVPLGTVHALLDEFARRRRLEREEAMTTTQSSSSTRETRGKYSA